MPHKEEPSTTPQEELPTCQWYAEHVGFCCRDLFDAMRQIETGGEDNNGLGSCVKNAYGPYQIERDYHTDSVGKKPDGKCGNKVPAIGGFGEPEGEREQHGAGLLPARVIRWPGDHYADTSQPWDLYAEAPLDVQWDKEISEHAICCYMRRYAKTASENLQCCTDLNGGPKPVPHGHWVSLEWPDQYIPNKCTSTSLQDLEIIARTHNGGPTMADPANWVEPFVDKDMKERAAKTKEYWEKVCRQFGAGDQGHPGQGKCKCT